MRPRMMQLDESSFSLAGLNSFWAAVLFSVIVTFNFLLELVVCITHFDANWFPVIDNNSAYLYRSHKTSVHTPAFGR